MAKTAIQTAGEKIFEKIGKGSDEDYNAIVRMVERKLDERMNELIDHATKYLGGDKFNKTDMTLSEILIDMFEKDSDSTRREALFAAFAYDTLLTNLKNAKEMASNEEISCRS